MTDLLADVQGGYPIGQRTPVHLPNPVPDRVGRSAVDEYLVGHGLAPAEFDAWLDAPGGDR